MLSASTEPRWLWGVRLSSEPPPVAHWYLTQASTPRWPLVELTARSRGDHTSKDEEHLCTKRHWKRVEDGGSLLMMSGEKSPRSVSPHHSSMSHLPGSGACPTPAVLSPATSAEVAVG